MTAEVEREGHTKKIAKKKRINRRVERRAACKQHCKWSEIPLLYCYT